MNDKVLLMILDGWGIPKNTKSSAIDIAHTPFIDELYKNYSNNFLLTHGLNVGLPEGQMGNSEVGHINLGAGRIIYQELAKINLSIKNNTLKNQTKIIDSIDYAKKFNKNIHLVGLISDGGVHSHINHVTELIRIFDKQNIPNIFIHAITDGRDVDPHSGINFIQDLEKKTKKTSAKIATLVGRYYAMDRDNRWDRTKIAYDLIVNSIGERSKNIAESIKKSYDLGISDEFLKPIVVENENNQPIANIKENDVVIFFNFRTDRCRQLTRAISQESIKEFNLNPLKIHLLTMTNYDNSFSNVNVIFDKENIKETLGEILSREGKIQIRIAETEKYPHVTFFFNGGREKPFSGEERILCPSPKISTYDLQPEMSAYEIRDAIIPEIQKETADFICLNFANPDMVGHSGKLNAAVKACETVDECVKDIIEEALKKDYKSIIISDHGNCEKMQNDDGTPNTAHTTNPVPIILVDTKKRKIGNGVLANIAPTVLELMGINKPPSMDKDSLILK
jgi:2,3-bisphosphoglycerate-independent phosphoglycerate mutase